MHQFMIVIGDHGNEGHGRTSQYLIESTHSLDDVKNAYDAAMVKLGKEWPKCICCNYGWNHIGIDTVDELEKLGFLFTSEPYAGEVFVCDEDMLNLTVWFIEKGNPDIKLKEVFVKTLNHHAKVGYIGYGVFV